MLKLILYLLVLIEISSKLDARIFNVSDYGAFPNDDLDDSNGIPNATVAAIADGSNNILQFDLGKYLLSRTISILNGTNLTIHGQGKDETLLVGTEGKVLFVYCQL